MTRRDPLTRLALAVLATILGVTLLGAAGLAAASHECYTTGAAFNFRTGECVGAARG